MYNVSRRTSFCSGTVVTSVRRVSAANGVKEDNRYGWVVEGFDKNTGRLFRYRCKRAVLATGTTDLSNRLGIPGEESRPQWITHDLNYLESRLDRLVDQQHGTRAYGSLLLLFLLRVICYPLIVDRGVGLQAKNWRNVWSRCS